VGPRDGAVRLHVRLVRPAICARRLGARDSRIRGLFGAAFLPSSCSPPTSSSVVNPAAGRGNGSQPALQDPGLALPYRLARSLVVFSLTFSFAVAGLIEGRVDPAWAPAMGTGPGPLARGRRPHARHRTSRAGWPSTSSAGADGGSGNPFENASFIPGWSSTALVAIGDRRRAADGWNAVPSARDPDLRAA